MSHFRIKVSMMQFILGDLETEDVKWFILILSLEGSPVNSVSS